MSYKKIIPCLDLENALEMAKFYNDAGADEIAYLTVKQQRKAEKRILQLSKRSARMSIFH